MCALDGQPKTVEEAVVRMQFFQHSRHGRPPKPKRDVMRAVAHEEVVPGPGDARPFREIQDLQSHIRELEGALQERPSVQPDPPRTTSSPGPRQSPLACYKCGEVGHYG